MEFAVEEKKILEGESKMGVVTSMNITVVETGVEVGVGVGAFPFLSLLSPPWPLAEIKSKVPRYPVLFLAVAQRLKPRVAPPTVKPARPDVADSLLFSRDKLFDFIKAPNPYHRHHRSVGSQIIKRC